MIRIPAELERGFWQEFSLHRLIAMPVALALVFYLAYRAGGYNTVYGAAAILFSLLVFIWGGFKAADAIIEEVNAHTWDFLRLSSISPLSLVLGRLFGATSYTWYGGLMVLLVYAAPLGHMDWKKFLILLLWLLGGLLCQATAMLSALHAVTVRTSSRKRVRTIGHLIVGLVVSSSTAMILSMGSVLHRIPNEAFTWYGLSFSLQGFTAFSTALQALWIVAGVYWLMRRELGMHAGPWLWMGFCIYSALFNMGLASNYHLMPEQSYLLIAQLSLILLLYFMALIEPINGLGYRRLIDVLRREDWLAAADRFPRWLVTYLLSLLLFVVIAFTANGVQGAGMMVPTILAFALRDIGILHFFRLKPNSRRATGAALFYFAVLYLLLPWLLTTMFHDFPLGLLLPFPVFSAETKDLLGRDHVFWLTVFSGLAQSALVWGLVWHRWNRYWSGRALATPPNP